MACAAIPQCVGDYIIEVEPQIGAGSDATVFMAVNRYTKQHVAVKVIEASNPRKIERALSEAAIHRQLVRHDHIIDIYDVVETNGFVFLFLEYAPKGHLGALVNRYGRLHELDAREYFAQMVSAIDHCHANFISHHDVKLENVMLVPNQKIRLIDFGLSKQFKDSKIEEYSGSPLYMSPEILSLKPHDERVDIWSLGVCLYNMVTDIFPFPANTFHELEEKVLLDDFVFPKGMSLSEGLKDLVRSMLVKDPEKRIRMDEIRNHPWMIGTRIMISPVYPRDQDKNREEGNGMDIWEAVTLN